MVCSLCSVGRAARRISSLCRSRDVTASSNTRAAEVPSGRQFDNRSNYMRGLCSDGVDRLGARQDILIGHRQETGRFEVMDREHMEEIAREVQMPGKQQALKAAESRSPATVVESGARRPGTRAVRYPGKRHIGGRYSKVTVSWRATMSYRPGAGRIDCKHVDSRDRIGDLPFAASRIPNTACPRSPCAEFHQSPVIVTSQPSCLLLAAI